MKFHLTYSCPESIDTFVHYMHSDNIITFSDSSFQDAFDDAFGEDDLSLSCGDMKIFRMKWKDRFINLILLALDFSDKKKLLNSFRKSTLKLGGKLNELKAENIFVEGCWPDAQLLSQFTAALPLCDYTFDKYKQEKNEYTKKSIYIHVNNNIYTQAISAISEGESLAQGICIARDLTNEPSDVLTPEELAERAVSLGKEYGFEVNILDKSACEELCMHAFLTVARGSSRTPQFIVMKYHGDPSTGSSKGLIGKGLCYDSGGLYLKPGASMEHSKADMAGGAAVIGAMCAIARNHLPVNVTAVIAACENMLDGNGYRNGDIVLTMGGKSVFVGSTDAEGRLTLADAITYMVRHEKVDSILELSTLTGSCANFFGDVCCGVLTTDDSMYEKLLSKSDICGEKYWRIPHFDEYREFIKSDIADLHNTSTGGAGGICAGLFLDEFKEGTPFMHLDVAGMTFSSKKREGYPKGGTGFGVKTIYEYIKG